MATIKEIKAYLFQVLSAPLGQEVVVQVPLGTGYNVIGRVRVELSRIRSQLAEKRVKVARFKINTEVIICGDHDTIKFTRVPEGGMAPVDMSDLKKLLEESEGNGTNG